MNHLDDDDDIGDGGDPTSRCDRCGADIYDHEDDGGLCDACASAADAGPVGSCDRCGADVLDDGPDNLCDRCRAGEAKGTA